LSRFSKCDLKNRINIYNKLKMIGWIFIGLIILGFYLFIFRSNSPDMPSAGTTILVTGAASGIGRTLVQKLSNNGVTVYAADLNFSILGQIFTEYPNVIPIKMDVTNQNDVDQALKQIMGESGVLNGIVNSAGISTPPGLKIADAKAISEMNPEIDVMPILSVNLLGMIRVNTSFLKSILHSKGCIVNIASIAGRVSLLGRGAPYSVSKFGVVAYSMAQRRELSSYNVRVICIEPGFTRTPMTQELNDLHFDVSQTILKEPFLRIERSPFKKLMNTANMIPVEYVSDEIFNALYCSNPSKLHVVVDYPISKILWSIIPSLPHSMINKITQSMGL